MHKIQLKYRLYIQHHSKKSKKEKKTMHIITTRTFVAISPFLVLYRGQSAALIFTFIWVPSSAPKLFCDGTWFQ